jgi:hypothetical protein
MRGNSVVSWIGLIALIAFVSTACGASPAASVVGPSPLASTTSSSPALDTASVGASSPSSFVVSALPEGVYRTDSQTVAEIRAALKANGVPTAQFDADYEGVEWVVFTLRFGAGHMTWFESRDGGPDDIDAEGSYVIEDGRRIVETDSNDQSVTRIDFTVDGTTLKTHWTVDASAGGGDPHALPAITAFFNTAPYTRQP